MRTLTMLECELCLRVGERRRKNVFEIWSSTSVRDKEGVTAPVKSLSSLYSRRVLVENRLSHIIKSERTDFFLAFTHQYNSS